MEQRVMKQDIEYEFEQFYRRNFKEIYGYVFRKIPDKGVAEDVTQDIFCVAYARWREIFKHPAPEAWLICVAQNKIREHTRRMKYRDEIPIEELPQESGMEDFHYEMAEVELVAIRNLRQEEWNLLKSYYWEEKSIEDLAESAGVTANCMRVRIARIVGRLRNAMKD